MQNKNPSVPSLVMCELPLFRSKTRSTLFEMVDLNRQQYADAEINNVPKAAVIFLRNSVLEFSPGSDLVALESATTKTTTDVLGLSVFLLPANQLTN